MNLLVPAGAVLIAIGTAGSATACYGNALFDGPETDAAESRMEGQVLAPLSGLTLAVGLVCVGIGMGNWRRPIPSDVRPANPYSDQPRTEGDPPVGQV